MPKQNKPTFAILVHYSEIGLKKNNRSFFEKKFINNLSKHFRGLQYSKVRLVSARILIENIDVDQWIEFKKRLSYVMGLANATLMLKVNTKIDSIKEAIDFLIGNKQDL